ncbi:MAG: M20 family metallopeptidase [Actinobacteria bacterium]|nr:M20 family metallopeptidase [Actinomycetota bacterium]
MSNFLTEAREIQSDLESLRRRLHQEPEIGLDLPKTQAKIIAALDGLGLEVSTGKSLSSVTAVLRGAKSEKTVLLRADMDALPVTELTDLAYKSQIDGAMHACGHDLHVAMLIGAAKLLVKNKSQLNGDVVFMFQPGEEGFDGAGHMIKEGVLDASGRKADATYGIHVMSSAAPAGVFSTKGGTMMASSDELHVTVVGMGGHGSQPHTAKDPIPVAAEMVSALQLMITRSFDAFDPVVITVGQFHAGTKANIIPDTAEFQATIRTFSAENRTRIQTEAVRLCTAIAEGYGLTAEVKIVEQYPVTVNNDSHAQFVGKVAADLFGNEAYMEMPHPIAGAEDYSRVLEAVPGSYVFLGASVDQDFTKSEVNHSPRAKFDDSVMYRGTALLSELAVRSLNEMV